jgi:hypothetical protein
MSGIMDDWSYKTLKDSIERYYAKLSEINPFLGYKKPLKKIKASEFINKSFEGTEMNVDMIKGGNTLSTIMLPRMLQVYVMLFHVSYPNEMFYRLYKSVAEYNDIQVEEYGSRGYKNKYINYRDRLHDILSDKRITLEKDDVAPLFPVEIKDQKESLFHILELMKPYSVDPILHLIPETVSMRLFSIGNQPIGYDDSVSHEMRLKTETENTRMIRELQGIKTSINIHSHPVPMSHRTSDKSLNEKIDTLNKQFLSMCFIEDLDLLIPKDYIESGFQKELKKTLDQDGTCKCDKDDSGIVTDDVIDGDDGLSACQCRVENDVLIFTIRMLRNIGEFANKKQISLPSVSLIPEYLSELEQMNYDRNAFEYAIRLLTSEQIFDSKPVTDEERELVKNLNRDASMVSADYKGIVKKLIRENKDTLSNLNKRILKTVSGVRDIFFKKTVEVEDYIRDTILEETKLQFQKTRVLVSYEDETRYKYEEDPVYKQKIKQLNQSESKSEMERRNFVRGILVSDFKSFIETLLQKLSNTVTIKIKESDTIVSRVRKTMSVYTIGEITMLQHALAGISISSMKKNDEPTNLFLNDSVKQSLTVDQTKMVSIHMKKLLPEGDSGISYLVAELTVYINIILLGYNHIVYTLDGYLFLLMSKHKTKHQFYLKEGGSGRLTGGDDSDDSDSESDSESESDSDSESESESDELHTSPDRGKNEEDEYTGEQRIYKSYIQETLNEDTTISGMLKELSYIYNSSYIDLINYAITKGILKDFLEKYKTNISTAQENLSKYNIVKLVPDHIFQIIHDISNTLQSSSINISSNIIKDGRTPEDYELLIRLLSYLKVECIKIQSQSITDLIVSQKEGDYNIITNTKTEIGELKELVSDTFCSQRIEPDSDTELLRNVCEGDKSDIQSKFLRLFDYHGFGTTEEDVVFSTGDERGGFFLSNEQVENMFGDSYELDEDGYISRKTKNDLLETHRLFVKTKTIDGVNGIHVLYRVDDMKERIVSLTNFLDCIDDFDQLVRHDNPMSFIKNHGYIEELEELELKSIINEAKRSINLRTREIGDYAYDRLGNKWIVERGSGSGSTGKKLSLVGDYSEDTLRHVYSFDLNIIKKFNNNFDIERVMKKIKLSNVIGADDSDDDDDMDDDVDDIDRLEQNSDDGNDSNNENSDYADEDMSTNESSESEYI